MLVPNVWLGLERKQPMRELCMLLYTYFCDIVYFLPAFQIKQASMKYEVGEVNKNE